MPIRCAIDGSLAFPPSPCNRLLLAFIVVATVLVFSLSSFLFFLSSFPLLLFFSGPPSVRRWYALCHRTSGSGFLLYAPANARVRVAGDEQSYVAADLCLPAPFSSTRSRARGVRAGNAPFSRGPLLLRALSDSISSTDRSRPFNYLFFFSFQTPGCSRVNASQFSSAADFGLLLPPSPPFSPPLGDGLSTPDYRNAQRQRCVCRARRRPVSAARALFLLVRSSLRGEDWMDKGARGSWAAACPPWTKTLPRVVHVQLRIRTFCLAPFRSDETEAFAFALGARGEYQG